MVSQIIHWHNHSEKVELMTRESTIMFLAP